MSYLFFDTETTGVPYNYDAPASDTANWPRIVQLGYQLHDVHGNLVAKNVHIVKPEGFTIPADASRIHGIATEVALRDGVSLLSVLNEFLEGDGQGKGELHPCCA